MQKTTNAKTTLITIVSSFCNNKNIIIGSLRLQIFISIQWFLLINMSIFDFMIWMFFCFGLQVSERKLKKYDDFCSTNSCQWGSPSLQKSLIGLPNRNRHEKLKSSLFSNEAKIFYTIKSEILTNVIVF